MTFPSCADRIPCSPVDDQGGGADGHIDHLERCRVSLTWSPGDAEGYLRALSKIIDDTLTADYWTITLPDELAT